LSTPEESPSAGVMDSSYASDRLEKPHLKFRLLTRALLAYQAYTRFGPGLASPQLVDFGCAEGLTMLEIRKHFRGEGNYTGIEYAQDLIDSAPPLPENVQILRGDVTHIPESIESDSIDLVVALAILEHLPNPAAALGEATRILRPGGVFIASCPDPAWDTISTKLGLLKGEHHESHLGMSEMTNLVTESGMELRAYWRFMFSPIAFLPYLKIPVPVSPALAIDSVIRAIPLTGKLFVNQAAIGVKPGSTR